MASLSLQGIQKIYPNGFHAVKDFNLEIADKEFIIFVGPSGCGKSTTLRMIAGLEDISGGTFKIDGKVMNDVEPKDRDIAMVFQNYALYPHMTVYDLSLIHICIRSASFHTSLLIFHCNLRYLQVPAPSLPHFPAPEKQHSQKCAHPA